jgi:hypothetical protein
VIEEQTDAVLAKQDETQSVSVNASSIQTKAIDSTPIA